MRIIVAPDKFKGSLSSMAACNSIAAGIRSVLPSATINLLPLADGGDGFAEVMHYYLHTQTISCSTVNPAGKAITATYQWNAAEKIAIIEMAAASGLVLLQPAEQNPLHTSTYGTGLMIRDAINRGAVKIILGLGGSATNDAGTGILAALGFCMYDAAGGLLPPNGSGLLQIDRIEPAALPAKLHIELACDVRNPLYGSNGAAFVYAPQKGADAAMVVQLNKGLEHFSRLVHRYTAHDLSGLPGAGAAGGTAYGLLSFLPATLHSGAAMVLAASGLSNFLPGAALVFTGEGKIDQQTLQGKLVQQVIQTAAPYKVPVIGLCGVLELDKATLQASGFTDVYPLVCGNTTTQIARQQAGILLEQAARHCIQQFTKKLK